MKKVVLISPYFGKLPNYFSLELESMKKNKEFTYLILTDDTTKYDWADNVRVIYMSFQKLQELIASKFDFSVSIERPYKLCDYKPAYGYIFEEYIKEYDFWGHIDLDVIWGDLKKYITDEILENYEMIYREGHLRLYKNIRKINHLFEQKGAIFNYREVYSNKEAYSFDESGGIQSIAIKNGIKIYTNDNAVADIDAYSKNLQIRCVRKNRNKSKSRIFRSVQNHEYQIFGWKNGCLFRYFLEDGKIKRDEFMYIHLMQRKMKNKDDISNQDVLILPNCFLENIELNEDEIKMLSIGNEEKNEENFRDKIVRKLKKMRRMSWKQRKVTIKTRLYFIREKLYR